VLDSILRSGAHSLGPEFAAVQREWLEARQTAGGGFPGRDGPPDLYYTDFALRALDLTGSEPDIFETTARFFLRRADPAPADFVGAYSLLSIARTLRRHGVRHQLSRQALAQTILDHALPEGGFSADSGELSAYRTFLAMLALEMLEAERRPAAAALMQLRRACGGFAERPSADRAQTNATAAALAVLMVEGALTADVAREADAFIASMQAPDGGLQAHPEAPHGDLLSSFTGLLTLATTGSPAALDLASLARFVRSTAGSRGGFGASPLDNGADTEYTFYGIATLGLLRTVAAGAGD